MRRDSKKLKEPDLLARARKEFDDLGLEDVLANGREEMLSTMGVSDLFKSTQPPADTKDPDKVINDYMIWVAAMNRIGSNQSKDIDEARSSKKKCPIRLRPRRRSSAGSPSGRSNDRPDNVGPGITFSV